MEFFELWFNDVGAAVTYDAPLDASMPDRLLVGPDGEMAVFSGPVAVARFRHPATPMVVELLRAAPQVGAMVADPALGGGHRVTMLTVSMAGKEFNELVEFGFPA